MSATQNPHWNQTHEDAQFAEEQVVERVNGPALMGRTIGLVVGGAVTLVGAIALAKIDWADAELDAPMVAFGGMTFTPVVAGLTAAIGLILILMAAGRGGDGSIAAGAIVATLGVGIVAVEELRRSWTVTGRQGWFAIAVGVVFVLSGLLAQGHSLTVRRVSAVERRT
ncbi:MAG: hypothetical protein ABIP03_01220 [Aquihabitans sp.]